MNNAMLVGPFVLPHSPLLSFAAVASTLYVGKRNGRSAGIDVEPVLWHTLLVGLVVARLAFVWKSDRPIALRRWTFSIFETATATLNEPNRYPCQLASRGGRRHAVGHHVHHHLHRGHVVGHHLVALGHVGGHRFAIAHAAHT